MRTLALAVLVAALAGCAAPQKVEEGPPPTLDRQELTAEQDLTTFNLTLQGQVTVPQAATLEKAVYEVVVEGKVVKSDEHPLGQELPAGGSAPFMVNASSRYVETAEELRAVSEKGGSLLAAIRGNLHVKMAGTEHLVPFARSKDIRTPRLPSVKLHDLDGARYSDEEVNIIYYLGVVNPNPFPLRLEAVSYKVTAAGKQVAEGVRGQGERVDPSSTGVFEVQASVSPTTYGPEVKKLVKSREVPYRLEGELKGELFAIPYTLEGTLRLNESR